MKRVIFLTTKEVNSVEIKKKHLKLSLSMDSIESQIIRNN